MGAEEGLLVGGAVIGFGVGEGSELEQVEGLRGR